MLTTKEFAEASGVPYGTLRRWRSKPHGTCEGRQGVLIPAHVDEHGRCFYDESQIDRARRLHDPYFGQPKLFKEMNDMTTNPLEIDAHNVAGQLFDAAVPVPDNANAAQVAPHAPNDCNAAEPVTIKQFNAWCSLVQKIRDGQLDNVNRLRRELKDNTGIIADRQQLIDLAGGKDCYHNFRVFLSQFNLDFVDDKTGELQRLVPCEDGNCRFESVLDADAPEGLIVDEEFQSLIPPLSDDERRQLEANILQDGIRDPLVVWQGHGIIVDGHNRHSIATKHGLPFNTREITFADRDAVKLWIVQNQFGRRNVNRFSRGELALKLESTFAAQAKANQQLSEGRGKKGLAKLPNLNTRDLLAKIAGVSSRTIAAIKFIVEHGTDEIKAALRADEITINAAFHGIKAGAKTVEDVKIFKDYIPQQNPAATADKPESPSPTPTKPAREVDSSPVEVQGGDVEVVGGECKRICEGKVAAIVAHLDDDEPPAHAPNNDVPAQVADAGDDVQDGSGDAKRAEIAALLTRVEELILHADDDALTVTKAGLAGIVAALEKKRPPLAPTGNKN